MKNRGFGSVTVRFGFLKTRFGSVLYVHCDMLTKSMFFRCFRAFSCMHACMRRHFMLYFVTFVFFNWTNEVFFITSALRILQILQVMFFGFVNHVYSSTLDVILDQFSESRHCLMEWEVCVGFSFSCRSLKSQRYVICCCRFFIFSAFLPALLDFFSLFGCSNSDVRLVRFA